MRAWLLRQPNPEAADAALARSLTSTLGVTAQARTESRFPPEGGSYRIVTGYDLDILDHAQIPVARHKVEQALTPATFEQCEEWLVFLQAATAHRTDSDVSSAVAYSLYASELRRWPADVAKYACERLARGRPGHTGTNWFPTLAELVRECERFAAPRQALLSSLKRYVPPDQPPAPPTEADRLAIRKMADDVISGLKTTSEQRRRIRDAMPNTAGKTDEKGVTPQLRAIMVRRAAQ